MSERHKRPSSSIVRSGKGYSRTVRSPRIRSSAGKVFSEAHTKPKSHHHNQNKGIPRNLRHELEDALLGLCDVWFEDIKPNLIRNNVKIHVEACAGAGDQNSELVDECSHLEPATTVSKSALNRLLFKASRGIERAMSQAAAACAGVSPVSSITGDSQR